MTKNLFFLFARYNRVLVESVTLNTHNYLLVVKYLEEQQFVFVLRSSPLGKNVAIGLVIFIIPEFL